jgi:diguanylate cyclase (GGDEF)-like protein/PAS domain S-box-containing protein
MRAILVFAVLSGGLAAPFGGNAAPLSPPELTSVKAVRHFHGGQSGTAIQVHLRAVVTYYDTVAPNLFVQDRSGGIWVDLRGIKTAPPQTGQLLDLTGEVGEGFSPYVAKPHWKVLGDSPMPRPTVLSYEKAATGSFDSQWSQMEGVVRSFVKQAEGSVLVIDVATPTGAFKVRVPNYHAAFPMQLVDAKVRFKGVCGTAFNDRNQLVAIHMMMPRLTNATVIQAAPADPFAVPVMPIAQIGRFSSESAEVHRVKVLGVVTSAFPGKGLFLMDATGGVYVESKDGTPVKAGDKVEVIGFPGRGDYSPVLKSGSIHPLGQYQAIQPAVIDGKTALKGGYDARLVTMSAKVLAVNLLSRSASLVLESDDHVRFDARFAVAPLSLALPPVDSRIGLTGICSIKTNENGDPGAFAIVLRDANDFKLLSSPPWLTGRRAAFILSAFCLVTAAVFGWVVILRKRVREQTQLIKARLENEVVLERRYRRVFERNLTGLYIATADGHMVDCNETCARILGYASRDELLQDWQNADQVTAQFHQNLYDDSASGSSPRIMNAEYRFKRPDGSWGWALANVKLVTDGAASHLEGGIVDITDRKAAEQQVQYLAYFDSMTGLPNRTLLKDRLNSALAAARRHEEKVAILYLDLDRFKIINDSLGHSIGDLLLSEVALRLQRFAREEDTVARVAGDEFVIVLPALKTASDAAVAAERIGKEMDQEFVVLGHTFKVNCSIGISVFPEHGLDNEALIKNADAAMYCAKESGRYRFRFFTDEMNAQVVERLMLERDLRLALDRNELFLMYQPQLSLVSGVITGFEALLRWQHPTMGLVAPGRFIDVAESSGLIVPIGEWVLRTACSQAKKWNDDGFGISSMAVNVSAIQFRQEGFCELVKAVLRDTHLPPRCLELELTESLLLSSGDQIFSLMDELNDMGINLAIDDFGTGYSSLSYLRQFPVSKLKIDGSFIKDVAVNSDDAAITTAIIDMGKALNLRVIAECVEAQAQLAFLQSRQCDEIQGYYFSKPLSASDAESKMRANEWPDLAEAGSNPDPLEEAVVSVSGAHG